MALQNADLDAILPRYAASDAEAESPPVASTISALSLLSHMEGGYFAVTDVSPTFIPSPYPADPLSPLTVALAGGLPADFDPSRRRLSTTIFYYLTPLRPFGALHRNRSTIVHALHRGRGRYVLVHPDGRVESFLVGQDVAAGERLSWVVPGGVYKASFLLDGGDDDAQNPGLLITETVVPGFEYADQEFLTKERLRELVPEDTARRLEWLVRH